MRPEGRASVVVAWRAEEAERVRERGDSGLESRGRMGAAAGGSLESGGGQESIILAPAAFFIYLSYVSFNT